MACDVVSAGETLGEEATRNLPSEFRDCEVSQSAELLLLYGFSELGGDSVVIFYIVACPVNEAIALHNEIS